MTKSGLWKEFQTCCADRTKQVLGWEDEISTFAGIQRIAQCHGRTFWQHFWCKFTMWKLYIHIYYIYDYMYFFDCNKAEVYFQLEVSVGFLCIVKGFLSICWGAFLVVSGRDSERSDQQNPGHDGLRERELHHTQCPQNDASNQATGQQGQVTLHG